MKWYASILHGMIDDYSLKTSQEPSLLNAKIDKVVMLLEKLFESDEEIPLDEEIPSDEEIPLETLIGLIHSTFKLLDTTNQPAHGEKFSLGDIYKKILGYAIIFSKTACDDPLWLHHFPVEYSKRNIEALKRYEREALKNLDFNTTINESVVEQFGEILKQYVDFSVKRQLLKIIASYEDKGLLEGVYNSLKEQACRPDRIRFMNSPFQKDNLGKSTADESNKPLPSGKIS